MKVRTMTSIMDSAFDEAEKRLAKFDKKPIHTYSRSYITGVTTVDFKSVVAALRGGCNVNYEAADIIEELQKTIDMRDNIMGHIALALFGEQNNRTDEECLTRLTEIKSELATFRALLDKVQVEVSDTDIRRRIKEALKGTK